MKKSPLMDLRIAYISASLVITLIAIVVITLAWCVYYAVAQSLPMGQVSGFLSLMGFLLVYLVQRLERIVEFICKLMHIHTRKPKDFAEHERLLGKMKLTESSGTKDFLALFLSLIENLRKK